MESRHRPASSRSWRGALHDPFSPDGKLLFADSRGTRIKLCDALEGTTIREWQPHEQSWSNAAFSSDNKTLVTSGHSEIRFWDVATGAKIQEISHQQARGPHRTFAGRQAAGVRGMKIERIGNLSSSWPDSVIRIWDVELGKEIHQLAALQDANTGDPYAMYRQVFTEFLFSPDGKTLATCGGSTLQIWDPDAGKEIRRIALDCLTCWGLAFSGDGKTVATTANGTTIRLFDAKTGQDLLREAKVPSTRFSSLPMAKTWLPLGIIPFTFGSHVLASSSTSWKTHCKGAATSASPATAGPCSLKAVPGSRRGTLSPARGSAALPLTHPRTEQASRFPRTENQ